jgi:amino acid transporter
MANRHQNRVFPVQRLRPALKLLDLSALSVSSVAPIFSVAAAGALLVQVAGDAVIWAIILVALPFLVSSWLFLVLNRSFPHAGASYHWGRRIIGWDYSNFQSWIISMAYLWSIPPILIPAATLTLSVVGIRQPRAVWIAVTAGLWTALAAIVLLYGVKVTARVTRLFLTGEAMSVMLMGIWGGLTWRHFRDPFTFWRPPSHWSGVLVAMVLAATIVDGWEIDSYAAEESVKPRAAPGWGGIIGAAMVVLYYLVIWPILLHEVPVGTLAHSPDVLITWSHRAAPPLADILRVAVLASTAGSLWLTTYILSRALYAMARDRVMPRGLGDLNRHQVPTWAVVVPLALAFTVTCGQFVWPFLHHIFPLVLGTAGFFLVGEFWLDGVNALAFVWRFRDEVRMKMSRYGRWAILSAAVLVVLTLGFLEVLFLVWGPHYIGSGIDQVVRLILVAGVGRLAWLKYRSAQTIVSAFEKELNLSAEACHPQGDYR